MKCCMCCILFIILIYLLLFSLMVGWRTLTNPDVEYRWMGSFRRLFDGLPYWLFNPPSAHTPTEVEYDWRTQLCETMADPGRCVAADLARAWILALLYSPPPPRVSALSNDDVP